MGSYFQNSSEVLEEHALYINMSKVKKRKKPARMRRRALFANVGGHLLTTWRYTPEDTTLLQFVLMYFSI
jgi:hypothetical protein